MAALTAGMSHWPTALIPALRMVWARTLFPSATITPGRVRAGSLLALVVLPALLLYPCMHFDLLEPDEGRYAEIPREMLVNDQWVVPILQGQPYLDKPPLLYWLVKTSYEVFGVHDWSARVVPALSVHACIIVCYLFGCWAFGERRALRAALLLSVMPGLMSIGRLLTLDGLLTLWVTLGLFTGYRYIQADKPRWAFWAWSLACALGVLTKGPIAVVLVLCPLIAWRWLHKDRRAPISYSTWVGFAAVVLAVNLPWYILMCLKQPGFLRYFFWQHNLERFFTPFDHVEPLWYYAPLLAGCLMPATLWVYPMVRRLLSGDADSTACRTPELSFCLLAAVFCVAFFSFSGSKLPTYILPAYPMLALAIAVLLDRGDQLFTKPQWCVGLGWLAVLFFAHYWGVPAYAHERSPMREDELMRKICSDPNETIICHPRTCDSVSFYIGRADLRFVRSKNTPLLLDEFMSRPRTIVLFSHRSSLKNLMAVMPRQLKVTPLADFRRKKEHGFKGWMEGMTPWGLCDIAIVERPDAQPSKLFTELQSLKE